MRSWQHHAFVDSYAITCISGQGQKCLLWSSWPLLSQRGERDRGWAHFDCGQPVSSHPRTHLFWLFQQEQSHLFVYPRTLLYRVQGNRIIITHSAYALLDMSAAVAFLQELPFHETPWWRQRSPGALRKRWRAHETQDLGTGCHVVKALFPLHHRLIQTPRHHSLFQFGMLMIFAVFFLKQKILSKHCILPVNLLTII